MMDPVAADIAALLDQDDAVEVAWLYGSRATQRHDAQSDFDVAVAFASTVPEGQQRLQQLDELEFRVKQVLELPVSLVDINRAPTPLAQNIITDGIVLICRSDLRLRTEEQRIWSLWEAYKRTHEQHRQAV